ncbi:hypothetical protein H4R33_005655 [Dimargaris cristalligena]|nr:hypothetical protein H4R33_005655 [Dimargaris cristalligena]
MKVTYRVGILQCLMLTMVVLAADSGDNVSYGDNQPPAPPSYISTAEPPQPETSEEPAPMEPSYEAGTPIGTPTEYVPPVETPYETPTQYVPPVETPYETPTEYVPPVEFPSYSEQPAVETVVVTEEVEVTVGPEPTTVYQTPETMTEVVEVTVQPEPTTVYQAPETMTKIVEVTVQPEPTTIYEYKYPEPVASYVPRPKPDNPPQPVYEAPESEPQPESPPLRDYEGEAPASLPQRKYEGVALEPDSDSNEPETPSQSGDDDAEPEYPSQPEDDGTEPGYPPQPEYDSTEPETPSLPANYKSAMPKPVTEPPTSSDDQQEMEPQDMGSADSGEEPNAEYEQQPETGDMADDGTTNSDQLGVQQAAQMAQVFAAMDNDDGDYGIFGRNGGGNYQEDPAAGAMQRRAEGDASVNSELLESTPEGAPTSTKIEAQFTTQNIFTRITIPAAMFTSLQQAVATSLPTPASSTSTSPSSSSSSTSTSTSTSTSGSSSLTSLASSSESPKASTLPESSTTAEPSWAQIEWAPLPAVPGASQPTQQTASANEAPKGAQKTHNHPETTTETPTTSSHSSSSTFSLSSTSSSMSMSSDAVSRRLTHGIGSVGSALLVVILVQFWTVGAGF